MAFEVAGAPNTPQEAAAMTRPGGKVILIGVPSDDAPRFNDSTVRHKGLTIKWSRRMKHTCPRTIRQVETGQVDVGALVSHRYPLDRIREAFEQVATYNDDVLRAVIEVNSE